MDMPLRYEVYRAGAKGHAQVIVLSHDVEGAYTHYWRGRSSKCSGDDCEACNQNVSRRWRGYLVVANPRSKEMSLLELTPAAMPPVDAFFKTHRTLRGALLSTRRIPAKENGRLHSTIQESCYEMDSFRKPPSVRLLLQKLWGLKNEPKNDADPARQVRLDNDDEEQRSAK